MWVKLQEDPPYFIKTNQINGMDIFVTDYIAIWFVKFSKKDFIRSLEDSNFGLEMEEENLLQKGLQVLSNPVNLRELKITKSASTLVVSIMTKSYGYPFYIKMELAEGSREMFFQNVSQLLLKTISDLNNSQQQLRNLLKKKDKEIEEYKYESGLEVARYLKTTIFNDDEHMKNHQVYNENAQLYEISETLLKKITGTCANTEIKHEAVHTSTVKTEPMIPAVEIQSAPSLLPSERIKNEIKTEPQPKSISPRKKAKLNL